MANEDANNPQQEEEAIPLELLEQVMQFEDDEEIPEILPRSGAKKKIRLTDIRPDNLYEFDYYVKSLNQEEYEFYKARREIYLRDYELNDSADEILLQDLLRLEIKRFNLLKQKAKHKMSEKVDKELQRITTEIQKLMDNLGMLRKTRVNKKSEAEQSIASLIEQFDKEQVLRKLEENKAEEELMLKKKAERDGLLYSDVNLENIDHVIAAILGGGEIEDTNTDDDESDELGDE